MRITPYKLLSICISIFGLSTVAYSVINAAIPVNRILGIAIFALLFFISMKKLNRIKVVEFFLIIILVITSYCFCKDLSLNFTDSVYLVSTLLIMDFISSKESLSKLYLSMHEIKGFIWVIVLLSDMAMVYSLLGSIGYNDKWGGKYYIGLAPSNHVAACGACLTIALTFFISRDVKNELFRLSMLIPATYALLQTGARSYILSIGILWLFYYFCCLDRIGFKVLILPIIIVGGVYFFMNSGMYAKILNPNTYSKLIGLDLVSAGRIVFWKIDILAYLRSGVRGVLLGNGFDFPYYINTRDYGYTIVAHNDLIDILMSVGLIGALLYVRVVVRALTHIKKGLSNPFFASITLYYLFVALVNGFFRYQHYAYSFLLLVCYSLNRCPRNYREQKGLTTE